MKINAPPQEAPIGIQGVTLENIVFNTSHTSGSAEITGEPRDALDIRLKA